MLILSLTDRSDAVPPIGRVWLPCSIYHVEHAGLGGLGGRVEPVAGHLQMLHSGQIKISTCSAIGAELGKSSQLTQHKGDRHNRQILWTLETNQVAEARLSQVSATKSG